MKDTETTRSAGQTASNGSLVKLTFSNCSDRFESFRYEKMSENKQEKIILAILVNLVVSEGPESAKMLHFTLFSPCLTWNAISQKIIEIATQFLKR